MKLVVFELLDSSTLEQSMRATRNVNVRAIRPHIYRHNFPSGTLRIQIFNSDDEMVAESETIEIEDIALDDFFHGYVRFYVDAFLKKGEEYRFVLVGDDGYSFSESAYCGWVSGYDLAKYSPVTPPDTNLKSILDLEIWEIARK